MRIVLALLLVGCAADELPASYPVDAEVVPNTDGYAVASRVAMSLDNPAVTAAIARLAHANTSAQLADVVAMANQITSGFTIESNLTIAPTGALHGLTALEFRPDGLDVLVPIGGLDADKLTQRPTAAVGAGGALELGDEKFTLALGAHAWQALELAVQQRYGHDLEHAFTTSTWPSLVAELRDALAPVALDAHFIAGTAQLVDTTGDGIADSLAGTWQAENDVGLGATSMEIAFKSEQQ